MMNQKFNPIVSSFVTGFPVAHDCGWVVMAIDELGEQEIEHSAILWLEGGVFYSVCLQMFRTCHIAWLSDQAQAVFVGNNGQSVVVNKDGQLIEEYVTKSERCPHNTGHLRAATQLGSEVIAVGMQRQVYKRNSSGIWTDMMQGLPTGNDSSVSGFECVVAISPNEIYAAGWHGEIWRFDGKQWCAIKSPGDLIITDMCYSADGKLRACGQRGLLIEGRGDDWRVIEEGVIQEDLYSIVVLDDICFIASLQNLYRLDVQGISHVDSNVESFGHLRAESGMLWSFGKKNLRSYSQGQWLSLY